METSERRNKTNEVLKTITKYLIRNIHQVARWKKIIWTKIVHLMNFGSKYRGLGQK